MALSKRIFDGSILPGVTISSLTKGGNKLGSIERYEEMGIDTSKWAPKVPPHILPERAVADSAHAPQVIEPTPEQGEL